MQVMFNEENVAEYLVICYTGQDFEENLGVEKPGLEVD